MSHTKYNSACQPICFGRAKKFHADYMLQKKGRFMSYE